MIRSSILECHSFIVHGVAGLKDFPIDRLPPSIKGKAVNAINKTVALVEAVEDEVDEVLKGFAKSELIDPEGPEAAKRAKERGKNMKKLKAMYPGVWRGRNTEDGEA